MKLKDSVKKEIIKRDKYCQKCGAGIQDIHHIFTKKAYPNLINNKANLIGLCRNCHNILHNTTPYIWFKAKFPERYEYLINIKYLHSSKIPDYIPKNS